MPETLEYVFHCHLEDLIQLATKKKTWKQKGSARVLTLIKQLPILLSKFSVIGRCLLFKENKWAEPNFKSI